MIRFGVVLAMAALMACSPVAGGADAESPAAPEPARSLSGTYVVTSVNQAKPLINIEGSEPTVTIGADRINFFSQCIYDDWSYTRDGESIATGPFHYGEPVAMCARALAPGEEAISKAFDQSDTVRFVRSGLWFSGPGGTVELRRVPHADELAARADLTGQWRVIALDGGELPVALLLDADFEQIWWEPGCAGQAREYAIDGVSFRLKPHRPPAMVCDIGLPEHLPRVWGALAAANTIERVADGAVILRGGGHSVILRGR